MIALASCSGCADIAAPRVFHPGSEEYQQARAQRFDPYPMTDVAPEVAGGRPLQYIKPAPENERVQNEITFAERYGQSPPPGLYRPPRITSVRQAVPFVPGPLPAALDGGMAPPFTP